MNCVVCNKTIARGQRYKSERYKTIHFCCEECYKKYCEIKDNTVSDSRKFTDYLQDWIGDTNWKLIMKQAKSIQEEYGLDFKEMRLVCKYAREYEEVEWDDRYGLGQIFPKYIQPCQDMIEKIKNNRNIPLEDDTIQTIVKKKNNKIKINFN